MLSSWKPVHLSLYKLLNWLKTSKHFLMQTTYIFIFLGLLKALDFRQRIRMHFCWDINNQRKAKMPLISRKYFTIWYRTTVSVFFLFRLNKMWVILNRFIAFLYGKTTNTIIIWQLPLYYERKELKIKLNE